MKQVTICWLIKEDKVLLGLKKRGFGSGKYTSFGGKLKEGETLEQSAVRELFEETGLVTQTEYLDKKAEVSFTFPHKPDWNQIAHVYIVRQWEGEPKESEEMKPEWYLIKELPYSKMWEADKHWVAHVLKGKYVTASFTYGQNNKVLNKNIDIK